MAGRAALGAGLAAGAAVLSAVVAVVCGSLGAAVALLVHPVDGAVRVVELVLLGAENVRAVPGVCHLAYAEPSTMWYASLMVAGFCVRTCAEGSSLSPLANMAMSICWSSTFLHRKR